MEIIVKVQSVDGFRSTRKFKTLAGARKHAKSVLGDVFDIGSSYAVSMYGTTTLRVTGCTLDDLLSATPPAAVVAPPKGVTYTERACEFVVYGSAPRYCAITSAILGEQRHYVAWCDDADSAVAALAAEWAKIGDDDELSAGILRNGVPWYPPRPAPRRRTSSPRPRPTWTSTSRSDAPTPAIEREKTMSKINPVLVSLGASLPRSYYVHATDEGTAEVRQIFPGGALRAEILPSEAWTIVAESFAKPPVPEETIASGTGVPSFVSRYMELMEERENGVPVVGGGATYTLATDSHACTVERVDLRNGKPWRVVLRRDHAKLLNPAGSGEPDALKFEPGGFVGHTSGHQRWEYTPNPDGGRYVVTRRALKGGIVRWKIVGHGAYSPGCSAHFRGRAEHYDHNF